MVVYACLVNEQGRSNELAAGVRLATADTDS